MMSKIQLRLRYKLIQATMSNYGDRPGATGAKNQKFK